MKSKLIGQPSQAVGYYMEYPTAEEVRHFTRELTYDERFSVISQGYHRGISIVHCYSLEEFAMALGKREDSDPTGGIRSLEWDVFLPWIRDVIGDQVFFKVVEKIIENCDTPEEIIESLRVMFFVRMRQYEEVLAEEARGQKVSG